MRIIIAVFAVFLLAACAVNQHEVSPSQNYVMDGKDIRISGNLDRKINVLTGNDKQELSVFIDGERVLYGHLSNFTGELHGQHGNKKITSLCSGEKKNPSWIAVSCIILIDDKRTVTLTF